MKKLLVFLPMLLLGFLMFSCEDNTYDDDAEVDVVDDDNYNDDDWVVERDRYRTEVETDLNRFHNDINEMDRRYDTASAKAKTRWQNTKARMNASLDSLENDLDRFGNATEDKWQDFKAGWERSMDRLENDWKDFKNDVDEEFDND